MIRKILNITFATLVGMTIAVSANEGVPPGSNAIVHVNTVSESIAPENSIMVLNYLHASLSKIVMYNDKRVLDDEYENIINNINLSEINDREVIALITNLMDTLSTFRLKEVDREILQKDYQNKLEKALLENSVNMAVGLGTIAGGAVTGGKSMVEAGSRNLGASIVNMMQSAKYAHDELEKGKWKLKKSTITELNEIRKKFLFTYWELMKRYSIPDNLRITENQFTRFVNVLKGTDEKKKYRQLLRMKDAMSQSLTYWFELSLATHFQNDKNEELSAFNKYKELNYQLLRQNVQYSLMLANSLVYLDTKTQKDEIKKILDEIKKTDPQNPERKLVSAMEYAQIGEPKKAIVLLDENIDDDFLTEVSQKMKLNLYLEAKEMLKYKAQMANLLEKQRLSVLEYLAYLGKYPIELLVKEIKKDIDNIKIDIQTSIIGKDDLVVSLPKKWVLRDVEDAKLYLQLSDKKKKLYDEVKIEDDMINFTYKEVMSNDSLKEGKVKNLGIKLVYKEIPTKITYSIKIVKPDTNTSLHGTAPDSPSLGGKEDKNDSSFLSSLYKKSEGVIKKSKEIYKQGEEVYKKGEKQYTKYMSEIKFIPETVQLGDKCFDVQNDLKACKK